MLLESAVGNSYYSVIVVFNWMKILFVFTLQTISHNVNNILYIILFIKTWKVYYFELLLTFNLMGLVDNRQYRYIIVYNLDTYGSIYLFDINIIYLRLRLIKGLETWFKTQG